MHTGEAQQEKGDYLGAAVSRAARIRALARGGQVFVSQATSELIADQLPDGVVLHDVGRFALAGMAREEQVSELRRGRPGRSAAAIRSPLGVFEPGREADVDAGPDDDMTRSAGCVPADARDRRAVRGPRGRAVHAPLVVGTSELTTDRRRVALLGGDAGMGKTRLTIEFARVLHDEGGTVLAGRCYQENVVPYQPFVEAVGWYLRTAPAAEVRADLLRTGAHLTRLVPDVAGDFPDLPEPVQAEPDTQRYLMFEAVNDLLGTLAVVGAGPARARGPALGRPPHARVALASRAQSRCGAADGARHVTAPRR